MSDTATQTHYRTCNLCEAICGIAVEVQGDQVLRIRGDEQDSFSRGHICPKALGLKDLYEDPERLRKPLLKVEGEFQEVSWSQALDAAADGIRKTQNLYGNDALGVYLGNPNVHNMGTMLMSGPFLRSLKTKNKFSATSVDQLPHHLACWKLFGHQLQIPVPDIDRCDYMVILGGNPAVSNGSIMTVPDVKKRLKAVRDRGSLIVIDPRRTETADLASAHHFIKPGTDVLLLLAMIHCLYASERVNPAALGQHLDSDPAALKAYFDDYSPERVAGVIGIPANDIRQLVEQFCTADAAVLYGRMGVSVQAFGGLCQYLILLFNILTGRLDQPGGLMFTQPAADILSQSGRGHFNRYQSRVRALPEFNGELPVSTLAEEISAPGDGQIKAMLLMAGNPVVSTPNGEQLDEAFASLDFMVAIDFYVNESNRHADVILPPVSPLEREHYDVIFHLLAVRNTARYSPALFAISKDAMHDWQIMLELQARLRPAKSVAEKLKWTLSRRLGPSALLDVLLRTGPYGGKANLLKGLSVKKLARAPHGIDLGPLQPILPNGLRHRDQKIHISADFFLPDLRRVEQRFFSEDGGQRRGGDFVLIGRRHMRSNNSWLHNSHRLIKGKPRCVALLHPDDAQRLGLNNSSPGDCSDQLRLTTRVGSVEIAVQVSDEIMPGVISVPHGWGHHKTGTKWSTAEANAGVSVNALTDEMDVDELSGNAVLNGVPVSVEVIQKTAA